MNKKMNKYHKWLILICPIVIVVFFAIQLLYLGQFNSREYVVHGLDDRQPTYIDMGNREDSTSIWYKRDFVMGDQVINLRGQTIDGKLINNSSDTVGKWGLRINIRSFCYINNSWCGTVCIHQFVGTENEAVQTLDLRNYKLSEVELEYVYDGDLLIPLEKGDYVEYFPSGKDSEFPVEGGTEMVIGMIFYFPDDTSTLADYDLTYSYHRTITQGFMFYAALVLLVIWLLILMLEMVSKRIYSSAQRELDLRKSGISSMSDMYDVIYIVDLIRNQIASVVAEEDPEKKRTSYPDAEEQFKTMFGDDATEGFEELLAEFVDISTLRERMEGKRNITIEYVSRSRGWCRLNFFAMDYAEGMPVDRVVFTLQVIENEKQEMNAIQQRISQAESERREQIGYFEALLNELIMTTERTIELDRKIIEESADESIRSYAQESERLGYRYWKLMKDISDYSVFMRSEGGYQRHEYCLRDLVDEAETEFRQNVDESVIKLVENCPREISDRMLGEGDGIKRIIESMLFNAVTHLESGTITLSIFSREIAEEDKLHILISVRYEGEKKESDSCAMWLKLIDHMLKKMNSQINVIQIGDIPDEIYFEVDQAVRADR